MVDWNTGMEYWNSGMLQQWALRCVLCMHCWLDGWLASWTLVVLHCMNFDPGQDTPLLSGACKATKHHSMSHTWLLKLSFFLFHIQRKEFNYNRPGICLLMSSVWAGRSWTTTVRGMCSISGLTHTQPWHKVGYSGSKRFQILFAGCPWDQTTATLYVIHISCAGGELA